MISALLSRIVILLFGILYPAYASYKTVKTKNVRDYVKWMMYWIVFALFTCFEIFSDIFIAFWFPFYYEIKILFIIWLICPATKGSTYLFRKFVNPQFSKREKLIDSYITSLWDQGYNVIRTIGSQGLNYAMTFIFELLRKGQITAVQLLPKMEDVSAGDAEPQNVDAEHPGQDVVDETSLGDEDFDIMMSEHPEIYKNAVAASSRKRPERSDPEEYSDSSASEMKSVKKRPLKVATKSKTRAGLRERKKKNST